MPRELLDGVFDVTCARRDTGRIRAFLFDDGTLVDTGLPDTTDALLAGIDETGIPVERVVVTHADADHVGGVDAVVETHDPTVYLPVGADPDVASTVDHYYGNGDEVGRFEAVHVPGHRGHQHALVDEARSARRSASGSSADGPGDPNDDEPLGVAVLADALSGADQRGLPAGHFHLPPGKYTDDLNRAEDSLERLLEYEFAVGLVFHGSSVLSGADERLADYVL